tara:strand:+ start:229 stop:708 length:480 start_codon:yes stop_codon:yes gene_type:complete
MSNIIATNNFLSDLEKSILVALLDVIIPADKARGLPSAAELNFLEYLEEFGADHVPKIKEELGELNKEALDKTSSLFFELEKDKQAKLCDLLRETKHRFARTILVQTLNCYYQDSKVLAAWGRKAGAQFPGGNEVPQGDLTLLDPVRKRGKIFRDITDE